MQAAVALRDWLKDSNLPGVVRYYGCPAEEGGAAKTFMVRNSQSDKKHGDEGKGEIKEGSGRM